MPSEALTRSQKRDLLRMSGAAVVSTVFFAVPMFSTRPTIVRPGVPSTTMTADAVAPGKPDTFVPGSAPDTVSVDTVSVVTSTELAGVTTPVLQASAPASTRRASARFVHVRGRVSAPVATPLRRRLARLIAGNGRYGVRPFPSVSTSGS